MTLADPDSSWFLFEIPLTVVIQFLERNSSSYFREAGPEVWHRALRTGTGRHLHLNVGIPGIEEPEDPIVENPDALFVAILHQQTTIRVILSGEWEVAVAQGLITEDRLRVHERAMEDAFPV
jgi:hypothetical protein